MRLPRRLEWVDDGAESDRRGGHGIGDGRCCELIVMRIEGENGEFRGGCS